MALAPLEVHARRRRLSDPWLAVGVALFIVATGNRALSSAILEAGGEAAPMLLGVVLLVLLAVVNLLLQATAWRALFVPVCAGLLLLSASAAYFMDRFGVVIDDDMIRNVVETDAHEAGELISARLLGHLALYAGLPTTLLVGLRRRRPRPRAQVALRVLLLTALFVLAFASCWFVRKELALFGREHRKLRWLANPTAPIIAALDVWKASWRDATTPLAPVGLDARQLPPADVRARRRVVVFVLGETASAAHFSLNGYERLTNPELAARDVISFTDVSACGTSTSASVPCMFSPFTRAQDGTERGRHSENVLDVLQRGGVQVLWRENNSGCKGVCDRVPVELVRELDVDPAFLGDGHAFDEALLTDLGSRLDSGDDDLLVVLHQQGSHGPAYWLRSPPAFKAFLPECSRGELQDCSRDEIVNAYDNTILYTDHVLAQLIDLLQAHEAEADVAMLYVSDHGESLGEDGVYLHGLPYWLAPDAQTHVPMVLWMPDASARGMGLDPAALRASAGLPLSHDNLFHSLLGLFDVRTDVRQPQLDLFAHCRAARR